MIILSIGNGDFTRKMIVFCAVEVGLEAVFKRIETIYSVEAMGRRYSTDSSWTKQARPKNSLY